MAVVFVFGSNLAGLHGAGAALFAKKHHGAISGQGVGRQGDSYGIPTKDANLKTLPLTSIKKYVEDFIEYAKTHPKDDFIVTRVGCGLAGYDDEDIKPMFRKVPLNCVMPDGWRSPR